MFDIKYVTDKFTEGMIVRDGKVMTLFDVMTDLQMLPKVLRQMAVLQGKLELTPELKKEREDILAWLIVYHQ